MCEQQTTWMFRDCKNMVRTEAQILAATWKRRSTFVGIRCDFMGIPFAATAEATCEEADEYNVAADFQIAWGKATVKIAKQIYERYGHLTPPAADIARWGRSYASQSQAVWLEYKSRRPRRVQQAADDWEEQRAAHGRCMRAFDSRTNEEIVPGSIANREERIDDERNESLDAQALKETVEKATGILQALTKVGHDDPGYGMLQSVQGHLRAIIAKCHPA